MIRTSAALLVLVLVLLAGIRFGATGAIMPPDDRSSTLLFVSETQERAEKLRGLDEVMRRHYGVAGAERLIGGTSQAIEARIFDAMRSLRAHDVLIVVMDLDLHRAPSYERVLRTSDFDPVRPWTGFPILSLRKLASASSAGTLVLIFPDCPPEQQPMSQMVMQNVRASNRSSGESSRTLISYCADEAEDTHALYGALAGVLEDAASAPISRASWQGKLEKGLVSLADVVRSLRERTVKLGISTDLNAGGGWLRVFSSGAGGRLPSAGADAQAQATQDAMRGLRDPSPDAQIKAINTLTSYKTTSARSDIAQLLSQSRDTNVRIAAARGLGSLTGDNAGEAALLSAAGDADANLRLEALAALGRSGSGPASIDALHRGLSDRDLRVREAALYGLGQHWPGMTAETSAAVATQARRLMRQGESDGVRAAAIWALAKGRHDDLLPDLISIVAEEPASQVRLAALDALGEVGDRNGVATLVPVAFQTSSAQDSLRIRLAAIRALGKLDTPESAHALLRLTVDPVSAVSSAAVAGLANLKSTTPLALELAAAEATPRVQRLLAIQMLARSDDPNAASLLFKLVRHQDAQIRSRAATALRGHDDEAVTVQLANLLLDPNADVSLRVLAADALTGRSSPRADAALSKATGDKSDVIRAAAATALAASPSEQAHTKTLLRLAKDESPLVREAVVAALGQFSTSNVQARERLESIASSDPDPGVRESATEALRALQLNSSAQVAASTSPVVQLGPFQPGQKQWRVDVFWCEGTDGERLKDRAKAYVADLQKFAESIRTENEVIASISLRSISQKTNALPGYQITQNELRYESGDPVERQWAERLQIGSGERFVPHPVRTPTPGYLSAFVCSLADASSYKR